MENQALLLRKAAMLLSAIVSGNVARCLQILDGLRGLLRMAQTGESEPVIVRAVWQEVSDDAPAEIDGGSG